MPSVLRQELPAIGYASGNFGKNLLWTAGEVTLLFLLTEVFGIKPTLAGALLLAGLAIDILIDLTAGRLAAGAESKGFGYRTRMLVAAGPCAIGFALLYALPLADRTATSLALCALLLFRIGYGFVDVPHNALLARLATASRQRGRVAGYRSLFSALAGLAVAGILAPAVVAAATNGEIAAMASWAIIAAILFVLSILAAWRSTSSVKTTGRTPVVHKPRSVPFLPQFRGDLLTLLLVATITGFAMPMLARNMLHLATYGFGDAAVATSLLTALSGGQIVGIAVWTWLGVSARW